MIVEIPVHPVTYKILLAENEVIGLTDDGSPIIVGNSNTMLNDLLIWGKVKTSAVRKSVTDRMTRTISIKHSEAVRRPDLAGFYLHKLYMRKMMEYVYAEVQVGVEAMTAIRQFSRSHDITEDDLGEDTIGRLWRRWYSAKKKRNNTTNYLTNEDRNVLHIGSVGLTLKTKVDLAHDIVDDLACNHLDTFMTTKRYVSRSMINHAIRYALCRTLGTPQADVARMFDMSRAGIHLSVKAFMHILECDDLLRRAYQLISERHMRRLAQYA